MCLNQIMSSQYKFENHVEDMRQQSKVKLTDLLSRINEEKKIERNIQSEARKLAEAYRKNSLKFASDTMDFEQAQSQITAQYKNIKNQFLSYGIKEPAPESSLYSDYVELEFFTNISESDYQYLGNDTEEVQLALNKRRKASEAILDRMSKLAEIA